MNIHVKRFLTGLAMTAFTALVIAGVTGKGWALVGVAILLAPPVIYCAGAWFLGD